MRWKARWFVRMMGRGGWSGAALLVITTPSTRLSSINTWSPSTHPRWDTPVLTVRNSVHLEMPSDLMSQDNITTSRGFDRTLSVRSWNALEGMGEINVWRFTCIIFSNSWDEDVERNVCGSRGLLALCRLWIYVQRQERDVWAYRVKACRKWRLFLPNMSKTLSH